MRTGTAVAGKENQVADALDIVGKILPMLETRVRATCELIEPRR